MPIYEFVCQRCKALTELLVKSREYHVEIRCPECGSTELERAVSRVNSVIAGSSNGRGTDSAAASPVEHRSCSSGDCSTITLPGHSRSS